MALVSHGSVSTSRPAPMVAASTTVLTAFHSHLSFGGLRSRSHGFGSLSRSRPRSSLLHRVVKTAFYLYLLHLFFTHGGLSILLWLVIIGLVVRLLTRRRRRRRRYAY
jgi:hypothetical protein